MKLLEKLPLLFPMLALSGAFIFSCEGEDGVDGIDGQDGASGTSALILVESEPSGENCTNGGFKINVGSDANNDGRLDGGEITSAAYACNGTNGESFLIATEAESAGENCQYGGFLVSTGIDDDLNGTLDAEEVDNKMYMCHLQSQVTSLSNDPLMSTFAPFSDITATPLISSFDRLSTYDGGLFVLGGSADGAGMILDPSFVGPVGTGALALMVNCEDHYSVARIMIQKNGDELVPVQGDYMLNSGVADVSRQCSGTMWETSIHGGTQDLFISSSETFNYTSRAIDPLETPNPTAPHHVEALGQFAWENNVPLPQGSYPGKTVIIGGDDDSGAATAYGQLAMYYSESDDQDLTGGKVYVLRMLDATQPSDEGDIEFGIAYNVEFVEIENGADLTITEMGQACIDSSAFQFMRVEDVDYGKGSAEAGRNVYFSVTGRGPGRNTFNDWGTGYHLVLDPASPLTGKLTQIISGNTDTNNMDGNIDLLQSPDNICVTENFIYWQEDPNSFDRGHQAYIWQTALDGTGAAPVLQIDLKEELNPSGATFSGEFGALFDISDKVGEEGTFILCLQPHYWKDSAFEGVDGDFNYNNPNGSGEDKQGSQIVVLRNVPR